MQTEVFEKIETIDDMHILPNLVDFVHRQRVGADRNGCSRGKYQRRAEPMSRTYDVPGQRILQISNGVRGAARSHKNYIGIKKRFYDFRIIRAISGILFTSGDHIHDRFVVLQAGFHKITDAPHDLYRIQFKTCWRFHQCNAERVLNMMSKCFKNTTSCKRGLTRAEKSDLSECHEGFPLLV